MILVLKSMLNSPMLPDTPRVHLRSNGKVNREFFPLPLLSLSFFSFFLVFYPFDGKEEERIPESQLYIQTDRSGGNATASDSCRGSHAPAAKASKSGTDLVAPINS